MKRLLLFLLLPLAAFGQTPARFDLPVLPTTPAQVPSGALPNVLAVTNATVAVCGFPAVMSGGMCTNTITTYTDSTLGTACPSTAQLTAAGSSACISTTGLQGGIGFWYDSSVQTHMTYTVQAKWGTFGPFDILQSGAGTGLPLSGGTINGALSVKGATISSTLQGEINGGLTAVWGTPEAAVAAACSAGQAVYFPAGPFMLNTGIQGCTGLRMRCAASDVFGSSGTVFTLAPGAAIWGFSNPNADLTTGSVATNVNASMFIDNCKFDMSQDSAALGAMRIKGIRFSLFENLALMGNNNPNPLQTEDGANSGHNDGDYDNYFINERFWDLASNSNALGILVQNASNDNHHIGGSINRLGTDVHITNGNNNGWDSTDAEGFQQNCFVFDSSAFVAGNDLRRVRCETGWLNWVANQTVTLGFQIIDSNGNRETVTTAGTNGATVPTWATTLNATTTDGTTVWTMDRLLPTDVIATGSSNNSIDIHQSGFETGIIDTTGLNTYARPLGYGSPTIAGSGFQYVMWSNPFKTVNVGINTVPGPTGVASTFGGGCADGYTFGCLHVSGPNGGEIQASRAFLLCNSSASIGCAGYHSVTSVATAPRAIILPDASGMVLVSGTPIIVTPTAQATAPTPNFGSFQLQWQGSFYTGALAFAEYSSGGTITGTTGQTCNVGTFNNSSTATATVALTGTNTIAALTIMTIVSGGTGATAAPTTAVLSSGTATCSGTVNLTNVVLGAGTAGIGSSVGPPVGTGSNPSVALSFFPFGTTGLAQVLFRSQLFAFNPAAATSGANQPAFPICQQGSAWNGSASTGQSWCWNPTLAAGANPAATLTLAYIGPGTGTLALPANTTVGGSQVALSSQLPLSGPATALPTTAIAAATCSSAVTSTVTGATSSMVAEITPTVDESTVTGYGAGGLSVKKWITANAVNLKVCNPTAASITPGALTVNVRVIQ